MSDVPYSPWREEAEQHDRRDPLRDFADRFYHRPGTVYLDGNSLGLLSQDAEACVLRVLEEWKSLGVEGWTDARPPWFLLSEELSKSVSSLIGASPGEVIVTGSTTVNLHQLLATLYRPDDRRKTILADALAFPSDIYAVESHLRLRGLDPATHLTKVPSRDGRLLDEADILTSLARGDVQLAVLPSVVYTSGQLLDMARITRAARGQDVRVLWDLSHSIGAVPHALSDCDADAAFWCHYKYLNAGPGAVGGLYLHRRHFGGAPGLAGWFSSRKERQFDMAHALAPAGDAGALQIGTPHVLSLAPLQGALAIHHEAGMNQLRTKSLTLTDFLRRLAEDTLTPYGVAVITPREDSRRGGHLTLVHPEASRICTALRRAGVLPDHRPPDLIRLAPVPLYTSFVDCVEAIRRLETLLASRTYEGQESERGLVP